MRKKVIDKNRIDVGKIVALRRAGWNIMEIADEMHMEPRLVMEAIYWYVAEHQKVAT